MADEKYILTIDVGTGSGRAILFDADGNQIAVGQREWLPKLVPEYPGAQDFDTDEAWRLLKECIHEAMAKAGASAEQVAGVTATAMREGMVLYDENKEVIWACPNADGRAQQESIDMVAAGLAESIYHTGGDWLSIISPPRLWWIKRHMPETYERIAHMNMLSDWVLCKFSGEIVTDPTIGSSSGFFDLEERTWSQELIELADLPRGIYADVHEPATQIGTITAQAAEETGLKAGTPVITGGADTQLALVGVGATRPGMFTIAGGTFWQTTLVADTALIDPEIRLRTLCHAVPDTWMPEGIGFYHGFTMRWFRDGFCQEEKRQAVEEGTDAYALMERLAETIPPGSNGVQPIFSDVMNAREWKHAPPSFVGFDLLNPHGTGKAACIRAIEENAAYTSRGHIDILKEISGYEPESVTFCGGSAKGFLWPQIMADVLGVPIKIPTIKESTSLGSAMCAGVALGWYDDLDDAARRLVKWERTVAPTPANVAAYDDAYALWRETYPYLMQIADDGVLPGLWRAPGV